MTNVKMPEHACNVTPYDANSVYWQAGHEDAYCKSPLYTEAQMKQYGDDRAREALEMAAKVCDEPWNGDADTYDYAEACNNCATEIRALAREIQQ